MLKFVPDYIKTNEEAVKKSLFAVIHVPDLKKKSGNAAIYSKLLQNSKNV